MRTLHGKTAITFLTFLAAMVLVNQGCGVKGIMSGYETKVNFVGRVVDATGDTPLSGVNVYVTAPNSKKQKIALTDELGYFQIQNMTVGKTGGMASKGSSGGLATVSIDQSGYKPFVKKYPIEGMAGIGSAVSTTDIGTIRLEKKSESSMK